MTIPTCMFAVQPTTRELDVSGSPTLYPVLEGDEPTEGLVELDVPPGVQVFTATFG